MPTNQSVARSPPVERLIPALLTTFSQAPYPDSGVRYAKYYKVRLSGNKFDVKPQQQWTYWADQGDASEAITTMRSFVTSITMQFNGITGTGTSGDIWALRNGSIAGDRIFKGRLGDGTTNWSAMFPTPLEFPEGVFFERLGTPTGGAGTWNITGWQEF